MRLNYGQRIALVIVLLIGGFALCLVGYQEYQLARHFQTEPRRMLAEDLIRSGAGDNLHVVLTNCVFAPEYVARSEPGGGPLTFAEVWVPVRPWTDASWRTPEEVHIVFKSNHIDSYGKMSQVADELYQGRRVLQGMIINDVTRLKGKEREELQRKYPKANFDTCWILEDGRTPYSWPGVMSMLGGGVLLLGGAVGIGLAGLLGLRKTPDRPEDTRPQEES